MNVRARRGPGRPAGGKLVVDREVLLDAAERVIARDGPGASIEAIAAEAGVTKPIVYARVGARAELCEALAERFTDRLTAAARRRVQSLDPSRDALVQLFRATLETIGEHRSLFVFVSHGGDDMVERTLHVAGRSAPRLAELFVVWRTALGLDTSSAEPWAYGTLGMLNLLSLWWLESSDESAQQLAERMADLVWPGIVRPGIAGESYRG
jgi:AcrR family transcriptional regulator